MATIPHGSHATDSIIYTGSDPVNGCFPVALSGHAVPEEPEICPPDIGMHPAGHTGESSISRERPTEDSSLVSEGNGDGDTHAGEVEQRFDNLCATVQSCLCTKFTSESTHSQAARIVNPRPRD